MIHNKTTKRLFATVALSVVLFVFRSSLAETKWPFYVPQDVEPPAVTKQDWPRNDIDRFILRKLESHGLRPGPEASRRTLVRRIYFDLIGLPPNPEEVIAFLDDTDPLAYEKLVDQLLDDPRYGEHWARRWLDLARYADTAGYEGDPDLPHAWRYRDYVIDSFNKDKPYDQFIKEQLAGDELADIMGAGDLPAVPAENTVALTFLRLAPFTEPRGDETRHEMLSEMTSTVGSVFLGLTVGCAKCHDHKHDNIPTEDFYRMKAFFSTVQLPRPEPGDIYQIGGPIDAKFYRDGEAEWAKRRSQEFQQQAASAEESLQELKQQIVAQLGEDAKPKAGFGVQVVNQAGNDYFFAKRSVHAEEPNLGIIQSNGQQWTIADADSLAELGSLSGANRGQWFATIARPEFMSLGKHTAGTGQAQGAEHSGKFAEILIYDHVLDEDELRRVREYFKSRYLDATQAVDAQTPLTEGLQVWLHAADAEARDGRVERWRDRIAGIELTQDDANLQPALSQLGAGPAVDFRSHFLRGKVSDASFLKSTQGTIAMVYSARHRHEGYGLEVGGNGEFLSTFVNPSATPEHDRMEQLVRTGDPRISIEDRRRFEFLSTRKRYVPQHLKRLKPVAMSLRHSYGPPFEPGVPVSRVRVRGEYDNLGKVVQPGFLSAITGHQQPTPIRLDPFKRWPTRSRRLALANWIASPENPMTARVMVNRLWAWHFGQGIVRTPSDFGYLSGGPSHRELLDWLAERFMEEKWSIKEMHRQIVHSATYRQSSSVENPRARDLDPDNRWLWRYNRRRLEAEAIRDSVLATSGRLNPERFGLPIFPPLPGDVAEAVKYNDSKWDTQYGPEGRKRSIYIYQQRTLTMPLMQTFDALVCDESRPRRRASVTPLQALAMYNGEFVNEEARYLADRVRAAAGDDPRSQVMHAFAMALGREPSETEVRQLDTLLTDGAASGDGLVSVCRVLLNCNEFIYVD